MKNSDSPMGQAFKIAIMIGGGEHEGYESEEKEDYEMPEGMTNKIKLAPAEAKYVEAMFDIVEEYGKLADNDDNGIWVGYVPASENRENASIGVKCSNCAFWCPKMKGCHIIVEQAEPNGYCRLAAIGEGLVSKDRRRK